MDGSHSKDSIPLEPEGNRRFEYSIAVQPADHALIMFAIIH